MHGSNSGTKSDRVLGDEWAEWGGEDQNADTNGPKRLFFGLWLLLTWMLALTLIVGWYMVAPRLREASPLLDRWLLCSAALTVALFHLWYAETAITVLTGKNFQALVPSFFLTGFIVPKVLWLAERLKFSRDKAGNSFVKVNNALVQARSKKNDEKVLVLLPRCLTKDSLRGARGLRDRYNFEVATVAGGSLAREMIMKKRPTVVIGVACERDLVSGIRDVPPSLRVMGIPNQRPDGPCKNTIIDLEDLEKALVIAGAGELEKEEIKEAS